MTTRDSWHHHTTHGCNRTKALRQVGRGAAVVGEVEELGGKHAAVHKATLQRALVDNHGVLHVVALWGGCVGMRFVTSCSVAGMREKQITYSVGNDGHDGVVAHGKVVDRVAVVRVRAHHGPLRGVNRYTKGYC